MCGCRFYLRLVYPTLCPKLVMMTGLKEIHAVTAYQIYHKMLLGETARPDIRGQVFQWFGLTEAAEWVAQRAAIALLTNASTPPGAGMSEAGCRQQALRVPGRAKQVGGFHKTCKLGG